ncbi:hypothetical protein Ocin01_11389 [Orchesella cincta]|uniref:F-box domain-containing protein n=1 Tax=Orchesella cincta TaxID=48709 RepID=A0A1D2MR60_ORCCI|nr:hypothetical protein Ocin01_11389 [Orchesella cincta]
MINVPTMSVPKPRSRLPFPFMELPQLAQIEVLRNLAPTDVKSARLTCSLVQELLDYDVGIKVVKPQFNRRQTSIFEYDQLANAIFDKKVRGLKLSFLISFPAFYQPKQLESITVTGAQFQWLETLLTRCKNLRNVTYYTFRSRYPERPSPETQPIHEIIEGFKDTPHLLNKLKSLTVKLSGPTNDYLCPMFLLFGGIKTASLRNLHVEIDMKLSLTMEEEEEEENDEIEPTTAQRAFAYICFARVVELLSENPQLNSLKLFLTGEAPPMVNEEGENIVQPLPTRVLGLLNKLGSEKMKSRIVESQSTNVERLLTLKEWVKNLTRGGLRKLSFNISIPQDIQILTTLLERQTSLRVLKVCTERTFSYFEHIYHIENAITSLETILRSVLHPENMEELSISHYMRGPLNFRETFENFKSLKSLKLCKNVPILLMDHHNRSIQQAIPVQINDAYMTVQRSSTLTNLTKDFLMNLEIVDLKGFSVSTLEVRQILELPLLRKIRLCSKRMVLGHEASENVFGIYSTDLVKAILTLRKLECIYAEPVIFRQDKSLKTEVTLLGSSGSIVVPNDALFLKSVGKLILDNNAGCSVHSGKYMLSQTT